MELKIKEKKSDNGILMLKRGDDYTHHVFNVPEYSNFLLKHTDFKHQREIVDFFHYVLTNVEIVTIFELTKKVKSNPITQKLDIEIIE
jgi:hypothetical protein